MFLMVTVIWNFTKVLKKLRFFLQKLRQAANKHDPWLNPRDRNEPIMYGCLSSVRETVNACVVFVSRTHRALQEGVIVEALPCTSFWLSFSIDPSQCLLLNQAGPSLKWKPDVWAPQRGAKPLKGQKISFAMLEDSSYANEFPLYWMTRCYEKN